MESVAPVVYDGNREKTDRSFANAQAKAVVCQSFDTPQQLYNDFIGQKFSIRLIKERSILRFPTQSIFFKGLYTASAVRMAELWKAGNGEFY